MIKDVTDLDVYKRSLNNLELLYLIANLIPQDHRKLKYQLIESGEKIAPQIAEGFGKKKFPREFCRFLLIALGSSDEVITHLREVLILTKSYNRINKTECEKLIEEYKIISKMLNRLHSSWQKYN